ncbi:hypothetical protein GCM10008967_29390 [Bacillus carboniphilus]|uniref:Uncharacterized protein n=1 Tax=Bacillus carboniphilus TaxID=86663 RepID=A0ABN0WGV3_9BACI
MLTKKRFFLALSFLLFITGAIYLYNDYEIIKLKLNLSEPIMWETPSEQDEIFVYDTINKKYENLGLKVTDLYYLPNLNRLHFGIWFNKSDKEDHLPSYIYEIILVDEKGNEYNANRFLNKKGVFDIFQYRSAIDLNLNQIEELYMYVYPVQEVDGKEVKREPEIKLIYSNK